MMSELETSPDKTSLNDEEGERHPPAPWRLHGTAYLQLQLLDVNRARAFVPPEVHVIPLRPGKVLGGIYLARYARGSTLAYHELIVVPAVIWYRGRLGAWVSHIYVDDPRSVAGGRAIWGLPKEQAHFDWSPTAGGKITVRQEQQVLCTLRPGSRPAWAMRCPLVLPAFGKREEQMLWFKSSGRALVGRSRSRTEVPRTSPMATLDLASRGTCLHLQELDLTIPAPQRR